MTRKSACLFCFALWTLVPGCLQLPWRGGAAPEGPTKFPEPVPIHSAATSVHSTAAPGGGDPAASNVAQLPQSPPNPLPILIPPLNNELPRLEGEGTKPPPFAGVPGMVTLEPETTPVKAVTAAMQVTPPMGPKKLWAPARAIELLHDGQHAEALEALKEFDPATQEFLLRLLPALVQIAKTSINGLSQQDVGNLSILLAGVQDQIRTRSELLVTRMLYCKEINGFANYVALPEEHVFLARTDKRFGELVQLYIELKNFASVKTKDGDYLTRLTCSLEVNDNKTNKRVWAYTFDKNQTTYRRSACMNDYHGNYSFYVPALAEGTYNLTIQIVDETIPEHQRVARKSLVFRVTPVANPLSSR
jgi:hypothetical protein